MRHVKKIVALAVTVVLLLSVCAVGFFPAGATGTGVGLAEWAMGAYNNHWRYVYGGSSAGAVDCSGLIYSYCGGARTGSQQLATATASGYVSSGIPRIHGLGLMQPGHTGVYVGNGMAVDARNEYYGVCYQSTATKSWTKWFKVAAVTYPTTGWVKFMGNYYYYENGQYVVSCTRTIGGVKYSFAASGISNKTPSDMSAVANNNSNAGSTTSNKTSNKTNVTATQKPTTAPDNGPLKVGSSGDRVTKLQNRLKALGFYDGPVTGYFGEMTEKSYKKFQKAANVYIDGIAGDSDLRILYSDSAPKAEAQQDEVQEETEPATEEPKEKDTFRIGDQDEKIVNIQDKLKELNYYNEESTGYFGDITSTAVIAFQNANGLTATGEVDKKTYELLFSEDALENPVFTTPTEPETQEETEETVSTQETEQLATESAVENETTAYEVAQDNLVAAQEVVLKSNRLSKSALSKIHKTKNTGKVSVTAQNTNFLLWIGVVTAIVLLVGGTFFIISRRRNRYVGAHAKTGSKKSNNVRYW